MLTTKDIEYITSRGNAINDVEKQIQNFINGFPFLPLVAPAEVGEGIIRLDKDDVTNYESVYEAQIAKGLTPLKFIPASGAASRMFKSLFAAKDSLEAGANEDEVLKDDVILNFKTNLNRFAFYTELSNKIGKPANEAKLLEVLQCLLNDDQMAYGSLPKGLLCFHAYENGARTPFQEHCVEGAQYACNSEARVAMHFTVSPEHLSRFEAHQNEVARYFENGLGVKYEISFSCQKASTDTLAVMPNNEPFRNENGDILFRPAGHGALIANLNELDADLIFIKNIDNVVPDYLKADTITFKKALAGLLIEMQSVILKYQEEFEVNTQHSVSNEYLDKAQFFLENSLNTKIATELNKEERYSLLKEKFNRPVRICGMVKNEGEPGGGPFWAKNSDGTIALQVAESSQINFDDAKQADIANNATHFNPVDLICAVRNFKGEKFNLLNFVDPQTGFISNKSLNGKELKAQELPGLWNGAMSDWNTIFVEVPITTFNPVKTVNDLLRKQHQPE